MYKRMYDGRRRRAWEEMLTERKEMSKCRRLKIELVR